MIDCTCGQNPMPDLPPKNENEPITCRNCGGVIHINQIPDWPNFLQKRDALKKKMDRYVDLALIGLAKDIQNNTL